jgi:LmbE family N-acetylglucosaminyl deacetylase
MPKSNKYPPWSDFKECAVIVAHPDDETLWAGGVMLMHPEAKWTVLTICRKSDAERSGRFFRVLEEYGAAGVMGDLDDGPDQNPLDLSDVQETIIKLLPSVEFDLIITHNTGGEYTRHRRHEETSQAVLALCGGGRLLAGQLWTFAYEDGQKKYLPRPIKDADIFIEIPESMWRKKYKIITELYGFAEDSFEARTTPRCEAFWRMGHHVGYPTVVGQTVGGPH